MLTITPKISFNSNFKAKRTTFKHKMSLPTCQTTKMQKGLCGIITVIGSLLFKNRTKAKEQEQIEASEQKPVELKDSKELSQAEKTKPTVSAEPQKSVVSSERDYKNRVILEVFSDGSYKKYKYLEDYQYDYMHQMGGCLYGRTYGFRHNKSQILMNDDIKNKRILTEEKCVDGTIIRYKCYITTEDHVYDGYELLPIEEVKPDGTTIKYVYWETQYPHINDQHPLTLRHKEITNPEGKTTIEKHESWIESYADFMDVLGVRRKYI